MLENNPIKEQYLQAKYQMFVNQKLKQDLAEKMLIAKSKLGQVNEMRTQYSEKARSLSQKFASTVPAKAVFEFSEQDKKLEQAAQVADRINEFDPNSRQI